VSDWFELNRDSLYTLLAAYVTKHHRRKMIGAEQPLFGIAKVRVPPSSICAMTHVDHSARVQTVLVNRKIDYRAAGAPD
jgi:carbamoyltransferase